MDLDSDDETEMMEVLNRIESGDLSEVKSAALQPAYEQQEDHDQQPPNAETEKAALRPGVGKLFTAT